MNHASAAREECYMALALQLAARGLYTTDPNPRVGCVVVNDGAVVGEGWHVRAGEPHAEVLALRAAGPRARGATAYVTLEPCSHTGRTPPCADALIAAGVGRVACATSDPNPAVAGAGISRLRRAGIEVSTGALAASARELNPGFFSRFERARPYVRLKQAMSLDGRTARAGGVAGWISGEASRADVQTLRARSSAVLTGAGTVRADDPRLNVRLDYGPWVRQPLRVVLDSRLSCRPNAKIFDPPGDALVFAAENAASSSASIEVERVPQAAGGLDLNAVLERLRAREVNELLVECGPRLAASFLGENLVDEHVLYIAPLLLGADAAPLADLTGIGVPNSRAFPKGFEFHEIRRIGSDLRVTLRRKAA
jgi:diaminohydroxyphosphoribosylaminopyrimidine deaminase / 5-amino-6-(5-phosphoribosylamino)uracil reductase